mgnify:CR=1 FL=1
MDSKSKAEITRVCDAGVAAYLAQQRSDYRLKSFSVGLVGGVLVSIPVYFLTKQFSVSSSWTVLPLFGGLVGGTYRGLSGAELQEVVVWFNLCYGKRYVFHYYSISYRWLRWTFDW